MVALCVGKGTHSIPVFALLLLHALQVAQAAARTLGIPLDYIAVKPSNCLTGPNSQATGSSITSELNVLGTLQACEQLSTRIEAVRKKMSGQPSWKEVIRKCYDERVDLSAKA